MRLTKWLLLVSLLALALLGASEPTSCGRARQAGPGPRDPGPGTLDYRYGVTGGLQGADTNQLLQELGAGWIRLPVLWSQVEPAAGDYRWQQVSKIIQQQARLYPGAKIMVTLHARSPWAGRGTTEKVRKKATVPPRDLKRYYDFVYGMAQRGRGIVQVWQIENEEEGLSWWSGTPEEYLALLRTAYRAVHAADPEAKVALGGFTGNMSLIAALLDRGASEPEIATALGHPEYRSRPKVTAAFRRSVDFINAVIAGGKDAFDVADIHLYDSYSSIPLRVEWLRKAMRAHGYERPIWTTEVGGPDPVFAAYSDQTQAQEVVKRITLALASGAEKAFWLGMHEMPNEPPQFVKMGLTANGRKKPAFLAFKLLIRKLDDLPYRSSLTIPGGYGLQFGDGERSVWVLWADRGAKVSLKEVKAPSLRITHLDGRGEETISTAGRAELTLDAWPIFVEPSPR